MLEKEKIIQYFSSITYKFSTNFLHIFDIMGEIASKRGELQGNVSASDVDPH